jgi:Fe-S-cluster containining protein
MNDKMAPLSADDRFRFSCHKHLDCFNQCCRNLNQFLTPFDVLRLKNHLGMSSGKFLARYTSHHTGPQSGLPVIALNPVYASESQCPFITPCGCSVYENRPSSCRMYPIARVITRSRKIDKITEHFMLLKESHCLGFDQENTQTVREWIENQGIAVYNEMNDMLMEIISLKNHHLPGPLDVKASHVFQMVLYDLDAFRAHIFGRGLLDNLQLSPAKLAGVKKNDIELLKLGHNWVKQELFGLK